MRKMVQSKRKSRLLGRLFLFLKRLLSRRFLMFCGTCTVSDRKDTKLLKAIHNTLAFTLDLAALFLTAKILNF